jgi:hypothetical protein
VRLTPSVNPSGINRNMIVIVDNIQLDIDNDEFNNAAEFVRHTDKLVYLTGKAGTGKTTFLKYIRNTTDKNIVVLAPTGVAAINAGGVTIHSFFQIPLGPFVPEDSRLRTNTSGSQNKETIYDTFQYREIKREIIEKLELLIIDEISMVRADTLDVIDKILRVFRRKPYMPFGGVQVILIGDTFQLLPIANNDQWAILSQFYKTPFFFSSKVIEQNIPLYIELKKIYRQNEQEFIDLLNRVRVSRVTEKDLQILNSKFDPTFSDNRSDYIILATHNHIVNETNLTKLNQLETELFIFEANVTGEFPEKYKPTDHFLKLKVGAQIMFVKNDTGEFKRYFNGKIGKIKELEESSIKVIFDDETEVKVVRDVWKNIQYTYNKEKKKVDEEIIGTFEQFPIRLAWAITVHKSQGLTFEKVIADLGRAFAPGQVYVALSRCKSLSGLKLKTQLNKYAIITEPKVLEFARNETPGTLITEQLNTGKADFYYKKARERFAKGNIQSSFEYFKRALKYRNDIDTEEFEKFIITHASRLVNYRMRFSNLSDKLNNELSDVNEKIDILSQEIAEKSQRISEQSSSIKLLSIKTRVFENDINYFSRIAEQLTKKVATQKAKSKLLQSDLEKMKTELLIKKKENESLKSEIERLKNLKWFEKLFGKE